MITYPIGNSAQRLIFSKGVVEHFISHQQRRRWQREAGGQLFARFDGNEIIVEDCTGPRRSDRRTRNAFRPDRRAERQEIEERFEQGLHFIGDWHTHPEDYPQPSSLDLHSVSEMFVKSNHALNGFVLVIVGRKELPTGMLVLIVNQQNEVKLTNLELSPTDSDARPCTAQSAIRRSDTVPPKATSITPTMDA